MSKHTFVFQNRWALGDTVCLSALVRDITIAYPGKYNLLMSGNFKSYWENNPHTRVMAKGDSGQIIVPQYTEGIRAAGRGEKIHFLSWFHRDFMKKTGLVVPVTWPKGEIHLSPAERENRLVPYRYWVVIAGGKMDMTAKTWETARYQGVVDTLRAHGVRCVQAGADFHKHYHPRLERCDSMIGRTDSIRDMFSLIYHADGVICGVTGAMHIAAVFDKPCVVVAGGREEPWWEAYVNGYFPTSFGESCNPVLVEHKFLHTVGMLDCGIGNLTKGCWKDRTVPVDHTDHTNTHRKHQLCRKPVRNSVPPVPACMQLIEVDHVVESVMEYYENGVLPPIASPSRKYSLPQVAADAKPEWSERLPKEVVPRSATVPDDLAVLDHPYIGGKFTVCVLGYGDNLSLMQRCMESILTHTPPERIDVRIALNQPAQQLLTYVEGFDKKIVTKLYVDGKNRRKYPAMREMFWDPDHPIQTNYVLWFDDDSHVIHPKWLSLLATSIISNHGNGVRLYGVKYIHDLAVYKKLGYSPEKWFREADWWKDQQMHQGKGTRVSPNGSEIVFASGGFIALATEAIRVGNIPDKRLNHNGGDITIGAQVHQAGFRMADFCRGKSPVRYSDAPRRGFREPFQWAEVK